jgi:hypothetical protein
MKNSHTMKILKIQDLPTVISLLPVQGAALFPRGQLPLPIMTARHFSLVAGVWHSHKYIGVIQKKSSDEDALQVFHAGTLGKVTDIQESDDGRLVASILGLCRFDVVRIITVADDAPMTAEVTYAPYEGDLVAESDFSFDRVHLLRELGTYFKRLDIDANWDEIQAVPNERLITALAMACPFSHGERQAILECSTIKEQSTLLTSLIEMANKEPNFLSITCH